MSWFGETFWSDTATYGDPFLPVIDIITDWGWSILPSVFGSTRGSSTGTSAPRPAATFPSPRAPIPVAYEDYGGGIEGSPAGVYPVFNGYEGPGPSPVRRETVVVEGVSTEVERHPEGDFVAGDIFAPGRAWGSPVHELDTDPYEDADMGILDGLLDWGLDTLTGQQPWQLAQWGTPQPVMSGAAFVESSPRPSGRAALPPAAAPPVGTRMTADGDNCGNRRYVTLDRETGKISCKRRRRRRLLTNRDLADLASLKTITGGGAALNAAVIRAVR